MPRFNRARFQDKCSKRRNILRSKHWHFHESNRCWHNSEHTKEISDRDVVELTDSLFHDFLHS